MRDRFEKNGEKVEREARIAEDESSANPWFGFTDGEGPELV